MKPKKKYSKLVLVEFRNTSPFVYEVVSDKPIKKIFDKIIKHFEEKEGFDYENDCLTILDKPTRLKL